MYYRRVFSVIMLLAILGFGVSGVTKGQEVVELTYARYAGSDPIDLEFVDAFMKANPDIKINTVEVPGEESFNTLFLQMQGGKMPEVFWSQWVMAAATSDMAMPLDDYIAKAGGETFMARFVPSAWDWVSWQGKHYGIQWRDGASVMFISGSLLKAAGLEVPQEWNWDTLLQYAQAMTDEAAGVYGFGLIGSATDPGTEWNYWPFLLQNGGKIIDPETNRAAFNSPEGVEALQFVVDLIHKYKVSPPGTESNGVNEVIDLFVSGKIAMWANGPWYIGIMKTTYPDVEVTVAPMPKEVTQGSIAGGTAFCISSQTKHPDEAWRFVEYMTSDENLTRWAVKFQHVPPNVAAFSDPFFQDPNMAAAVEQSKSPDTIAANHYPETDQLNQIMRNYLQAAYLQQMTPQEALDAAAAEWDDILAKYDAK
jgi:multiple sugar transport system substrate-binding protein